MRHWIALLGLMLWICLSGAASATATSAKRWLDNYDQADRETKGFHHIQIMGAYDGMAWVIASQKSEAQICVPGAMVMEHGQLISVLRQFITKTDRSFAEKPFGYALFAALRFTFPCPRP